MTTLRVAALAVMVAGFAASISAQAASEHDGHHPEGTATAPAAQPASPEKDAMGKMERHVQAMQAMHEKMMAAKTPEQRQALMGEHMKLMQEGMSMMKGMPGGMMSGKGGTGSARGKSGSMEDRHQMMERRMEMMESMMQMMMDRMPTEPSR